MALKIYKWRGYNWQFEEARAPVDAVPVEKAAKPAANKAAKQPANKARKAAPKKAE